MNGILAAFVVDRDTGHVSGCTEAESALDLELDAINSAEILRLAQSVVARLDPGERIETLVFALGTQDHIIVASRRDEGRFLYVVLDKAEGNLGLLLHRLAPSIPEPPVAPDA